MITLHAQEGGVAQTGAQHACMDLLVFVRALSPWWRGARCGSEGFGTPLQTLLHLVFFLLLAP